MGTTCAGGAQKVALYGAGVGRGFLEQRSLQLLYAAYSATSQRAPTRGLWGPSLASTSTRNQKAPAPGSTLVLESNPISRKSLCCLAQNPPPPPVPEGRVTGGHPDHNSRGGNQRPHLHLTHRLPLPGLARWRDEHSQRYEPTPPEAPSQGPAVCGGVLQAGQAAPGLLQRRGLRTAPGWN